ncbi:acyltransferase [Chitinophagaceae bacterium 26-R-25]|nr:acyltransferase [Chitinophagaceae bacterium 26-R-25]
MIGNPIPQKNYQNKANTYPLDKFYLKGLNTLRFFAAFFVIISHAQISISKMLDRTILDLPVFNRGADAVEFFFTLSGFLITYLLQKEIEQTSTVSIKKFYLRRVFRIWPLYFLIIIIGFFLLGYVYPHQTGKSFFEFPIIEGITWFVFFLPNVATSFYPTGMLYPLWSIGVEEQYYLFWAPLVKKFKKYLLPLVIVFFLVSFLWYYLVNRDIFGFSPKMSKFLLSQKFFAMALGSLFSVVMYRFPDWYKKSIFASKGVQVLVILALAYYYLIGYPYFGGAFVHLALCVLYGLLIVNTAFLEKPVVSFEQKFLNYLGTISYGLYMYHMCVDYILRYIFSNVIKFGKIPLPVAMPLYHVLLLALTIIVASISYKYFESYFLRLKKKYA